MVDLALSHDNGARRPAKSPDAFRTISEVAEELDVPQHVLRFWESKFPQLKPLKRGGGRRYYRPEDVLLLKGIRHLLYDQGFTIQGARARLRETGGAGNEDASEADGFELVSSDWRADAPGGAVRQRRLPDQPRQGIAQCAEVGLL